MSQRRQDPVLVGPRQFGLRALFRVTLYCAVASAILRLIPVATLQDLGGLLLVGVLLTLPTLAVLLVISLVAWLVERL
jgi:hypothetical protein